MKRIVPGFLAALALLAAAASAHAQTIYKVVAACPGGSVYSAGTLQTIPTMDVNGTPCGSATLSGGTVTANTTEKSTASAPTYSEGTNNPLSGDLSGNLRTLDANSAAALSALQAPIPAGTNLIGVVGNTQGSTTSGQSGPLVQGAVTTSSPTYTTGQTAPLSLDTTGALRISAPAAAPVNVTVNSPPNDVLSGPTSLTGAGDVVVSAQGSGSVSLQITGTFTGLSGLVQGSDDGATYVNIGYYNANTGASLASGTVVTATGIYVVPDGAYRTIRYHVTAVATGTAVVSLNSSAGSLDPPSSTSGAGKQVNLTGINGTTPLTGNGVTGPGSARVTIASDNTAFSVNSTLQTQTDTTMVGGVNVKEFNGVTPLMNNGVSGTGSQRVNIASDNTAFSVNPQATSTTGVSTFSKIVANNTTSVAVDASAGTALSVRVFNNSATIAYLKLYNAAQGSTTCGSGTPVNRILIPANTAGAGAVFSLGGGFGVAYGTAITACVTTGIADNDTTAPAASAYIYEVDYK